MISLAFYSPARKGSATFLDRCIQLRTLSRYSHCELVDSSGLCWSSSGRDGGVRSKSIDTAGENWVLVPLGGFADAQLHAFFHDKIGSGYDYRAIFWAQALGIDEQSRDRWFCSEICAAFIGIQDAHKLSPGGLLHHVLRNHRCRIR